MEEIYCDGSKKAQIELDLPEEILTVISEYPPVTVKKNEDDLLVSYSGLIGVPCYKAQAWLDPTSPAVWVWNAPFSSPKKDSDEYADFNLSFESEEDQAFNLICAVDNKAEISLNGHLLGGVEGFISAKSFNFVGKKGANTLSFRCTNSPNGSTVPTTNPAGLYFELRIPNGCMITISDKLGQLYNKILSSCPDYKVGCDDNCPDGFIKCSSNKHPGYCCISCKEIAEKINTLSNKI